VDIHREGWQLSDNYSMEQVSNDIVIREMRDDSFLVKWVVNRIQGRDSMD
jgi:hypothetical protein